MSPYPDYKKHEEFLEKFEIKGLFKKSHIFF